MTTIQDLTDQEQKQLKKLTNFKLAKEYASKTIKTSDNKYGYVTSTGIVKPYADSNLSTRCPREVTTLKEPWSELNYPIGSMMTTDQSCGNEGKYVQSFPAENASIENLRSVGKVGYVDLDTFLHPINDVTYSTTYKSVKQQIRGDKMRYCSKVPKSLKYNDIVFIVYKSQTDNLFGDILNSAFEFSSTSKTVFILKPPANKTGLDITYGDQVIISPANNENKKAFFNDATNAMDFGDSESLFYFQQPAGSTIKTGQPILYGNQVCIRYIPETGDTTDCGVYGCKVGYVDDDNMLVFDKWDNKRNGATLFTIESYPDPYSFNKPCNKEDLMDECNSDSNCIGFIFDDTKIEWQKLTDDTQIMKSNDTYQNTLFIKKAESVNKLNDSSCIEGTVLQIDSSLYNDYPKGMAFISGGSGQCNVGIGVIDNSMTSAQSIFNKQLKSFTEHQINSLNSSKVMRKEYNKIHGDTESKIKEYNKLNNNLENKSVDETLLQHQKDNEIIIRQKQFNVVLWSLVAVACVFIIVSDL